MIYLKRLTVDISGKSSLRTIMYSKQGDGRMYALHITITDDGEPYLLDPSEVRVMLSAHKPDGTNILDDDPETIWINDGEDDAGTVGVMLKPTMQAAAGNVLIEIIVLDNQNNQITTANIINCVLPRAVREDEIASSDDYVFLQKLIIDAHKTYDDVKDYADAADQSAIDAQGSAETAALAALAAEESGRDAAGSASSAHESKLAAAASALAAAASQLAASMSEGSAGESATAALNAAAQAAKSLSDLLALYGSPGGFATLDATGKLSGGQIPHIAITDTIDVNSIAEMLALADEQVQRGDVVRVFDGAEIVDTYIYQGTDPSDINSWKKFLVGYAATAGHADSATTATDSEKINGKRMVRITKSAHTAMINAGTWTADTHYIVRPDPEV